MSYSTSHVPNIDEVYQSFPRMPSFILGEWATDVFFNAASQLGYEGLFWQTASYSITYKKTRGVARAIQHILTALAETGESEYRHISADVSEMVYNAL
jgi:hypothetical protein